MVLAGVMPLVITADGRRAGAVEFTRLLGLGLVALQPGSVPFSSTSVRELLAVGDVAGAAEVLGRPHELRGTLGIHPLTITAGDLGDVSALGIYMTDPNLNLNDPNNTATGLGGALIADLDPALPGGTGVLVPQTDTSTSSFTGTAPLLMP